MGAQRNRAAERPQWVREKNQQPARERARAIVLNQWLSRLRLLLLYHHHQALFLALLPSTTTQLYQWHPSPLPPPARPPHPPPRRRRPRRPLRARRPRRRLRRRRPLTARRRSAARSARRLTPPTSTRVSHLFNSNFFTIFFLRTSNSP